MGSISLQGRIIVLLVLFTILSIAAFMAVQLTHELKVINKYKESEALVVSLAVENIWEKVSNLKVPPEMKVIFLQKKLYLLKDSNTILNGYILDTSGKIVSSTDSREVGRKGNIDDSRVIYKSQKKDASVKGELVIDRVQKQFSFYLPLGTEEENQFFVRMFFSLGDMDAAFKNIFSTASIIGVAVILINIALGVFLSRLVVGPIKFFNDAASKIAAGRLDLRVSVSTSDELEELAKTFNYMTSQLIIMKERAENANPLTKLPGNIVIMEQVEQRIKTGKKFTVIYCDLDNFKAFNDKYGIHKGDEAIIMTGDIFKKVMKQRGNPDDFVGHEGGDDFILLTVPEKANDIAAGIIEEFDKNVRHLYNTDDLDRGFIIAHARDGSIKQFPIMTISLAGVTNVHRPIKAYAEVTNIAAEVKKKAKKNEKSCFVLDLRAA